MTSGAITGVNRSITAGDQGSSDTETLHGMLQTDAYIAAGDSGGPLVNSSGQVIGMDTAAASNTTGQSGNIGFAIPVNHALSIATRDSGRAQQFHHPDRPARLPRGGRAGHQQRLPDPASVTSAPGGGIGGTGGSTAPASSGALVCQVYNGTPAQSAGVAAGDVITGVNGTTVTSAQSLTTAMQSKRPRQQCLADVGGHQRPEAHGTLTLTAGPAD